MLVVAAAPGGQRSFSSTECSHVTFLLFKHRLFAPSPLISLSLFPSLVSPLLLPSYLIQQAAA